MMSEEEVKVLELLSNRLVAKLSEIRSGIGEGGADGIKTTVHKLVSMDFVKMIEPIGDKCYVITKKGSRILKELKNPERRPQGRGNALDGSATFGQLSLNV
jgi:hypothetical protein